jgi:hypothetical protein
MFEVERVFTKILNYFSQKKEMCPVFSITTAQYVISGANLSTPRPEGRALPFDKLKAPSTAEGLKVHPAPRFSPRL